MSRTKWTAVLVFSSLLILAGIMGIPELGWMGVRHWIKQDFPRVDHISVSDLAAWLEDDSRPPPLLVDVRESDEFSVSHLRDAVHFPPGTPVDRVAAAANGRPIVLYCSVGYRSSRMASELMAAGSTNVYNLDGSIFAWANAGYPVWRGDTSVTTVHPYNTSWGMLLRKKLRSR